MTTISVFSVAMDHSTILAVSQSTAACACVIMRSGEVLSRREWDSGMINNHRVFEMLPSLMDEAGITPADIDFFAADTGPGSFAGIRTAISTLNGLALPSHRPVTGVSCGEAIASDILKEQPDKTVLVVGDARRQRLWYAQFSITDDEVTVKSDYRLVTNEEFPELIEQNTIIVTPDWHRLEEYLTDVTPTHAELIKAPGRPDASTIAEIAIAGHNPDTPLKPVQPLYMHPPVQHK